jgi:hypothetical protein
MRKRYLAAAPVVVALAGLLLVPAYLGAYFGMLRRDQLSIGDVIPGSGCYELLPLYRVEGAAVSTFFWPAHQIDRRLFPARWKAELMVD